MKKLIELDAALEGVANILDYEIAKGHSGSISRKGVVDMLTTLPTVDAVPVVRCKNCMHWGKYPVSTVLPQYHKCGMATYKSTKGDDFCSDGKDDDNG